MFFPEVVSISFTFSFVIMYYTVNNHLIRSRNPIEYNVILHNKTGKLIQDQEDGFLLLEFDIKVKKQIKLESKTFYKMSNLQWYIHKSDLNIRS
jgi:hypothetical protein